MEEKNGKIWQRIAQIRQYFCGGNNLDFAERLEKEPTYTSQLCNGTKATGKKVLELILSKFPQVSRTWLLLGEGEMLRNAAGTPFDARYMAEPMSEGRAKAERSYSEGTLLQMYTEAIRENERLRMENKQLREKLLLLSGETVEGAMLP